MKKIFIFLTAFGLTFSALAQNSGRISGSIKDGGNQKVIDAATISLLNPADSSLLKTSVTDKDGNFSFEGIKDGSYLVKASSLGHNDVFSSTVTISQNAVAASTGVLQLTPVSKNMKEVVVTAKKPFIERKLDKTILNVDASITNTGSTALEVLEKAPGVTVDKDGNISLKGKTGVIIMMDGKPTYMSGPDLSNFLRNLPSSNLDQIEIMTNPSAKYDASGNSGIINIKTKKIKQKGFNGSLSTSYGQGSYPKTNNSLNLNYRVNKINIFSTLSANYREQFQELNIHRRYLKPDKSTRAIFDQRSWTVKHRHNYNAKIGMDYYANAKTTFGIVLTGYTTPGDETGTNTSYLKNSFGEVDSITTAARSEDYTWKHGGVNLNMRHVFDSTGREFTMDFDYLAYDANRNQFFSNTNYTADWTRKSGDELKGTLPSDIKIYSGKMDYVHPFRKDVKFETGVKTSFVSTDNNAGYFNIVDGNSTPDYGKTNRFQYKENINAAYVNLSKTGKKWSFQGGLRLENTNYDGYQFGNPERQDSAFKKSYTNIFPTTYIGYTPSDKHQWGLSLGRRISRPDYEDLNPFLFFLDNYTFEAGNPYLRPEYANVLELSHTYKQYLTTTLNYSHTTDLFNEVFRQEGQYATIVSEGNFGMVDNASLSVNAQTKITKWWNTTIYGEGRYQHIKANLNGEDVDEEGYNYLFHTNNQFTFKKGWSAELSGFYRSESLSGQIIISPLWALHTGIQKQILKNKGSIKVAVRDIFYTQNTKGKIDFQTTRASFSQNGDSRVVTVSFNYRFGKPIKGLQKRKTGGAGDEQNRIKTGN